jgi:hypothetical protein
MDRLVLSVISVTQMRIICYQCFLASSRTMHPQPFLLCSFSLSFVGGDANAAAAEAKEQVDARSVYVGNVRFYKPSLSSHMLGPCMLNVGSAL